MSVYIVACQFTLWLAGCTLQEHLVTATLISLCKPRHTTLFNIEVERSKGFHTAVAQDYSVVTCRTLSLSLNVLLLCVHRYITCNMYIQQ